MHLWREVPISHTGEKIAFGHGALQRTDFSTENLS